MGLQNTRFVVYDIEAIATPECRSSHEHPPDTMPPPMCFRLLTCAYQEVRLGEHPQVRPPVLIGAMEPDPYPDDADLDAIALEAERSVITHMTKGATQTGACLVSWNGRGFDLPLLVAAAATHGISAPWLFEDAYTNRYRGAKHIDLQDVFSICGASRPAKMAYAAERIGWPGKVGMHGGDVAKAWNSGQAGRELVRAYNICDTVQETAVFLRFAQMRGWLDEEAYWTAATQLLGIVDTQTWTLELRDKINREAFLRGGRAPAPAPEQ